MLSASAIVLSMAYAVQAEDAVSADTVVATVNGAEIKLGHMMLVRETLPQQYLSLGDDQLFQGILEQLIQQTLIAQQSATAQSPRIRLGLENEERLLVAAQAIDAMSSELVTDEAIKAAYDAQFANVEMGFEYNASHILVETKEAAEKLVERANAGEDFAELAKEASTGPSGPNGGSLGWFGKGMMVPPFEQAVVAMEAGAISGPVQTDFGWHVIKLNETRPVSAPELDSVREEIATEIQQTMVSQKIEELMATATIDRSGVESVDPALLKDASLLE